MFLEPLVVQNERQQLSRRRATNGRNWRKDLRGWAVNAVSNLREADVLSMALYQAVHEDGVEGPPSNLRLLSKCRDKDLNQIIQNFHI